MLKYCLVLLVPFAMGIRVIGHGGGEAESAILAQVDRLPLFLEPCLATSNPCHLTAKESKWLRELVSAGRLGGRHTDISFFSNPQGSPMFRYYSDWIFGIRTEELYEAGRPKPVSEIARILFLGTMGQAKFVEHNREIDLDQVSRKLFGQWTLDRQLIPQSDSFVRVLNFRHSSNPAFALVQLDSGEVADVTTQITDVLPCSDVTSIGHLTEEDNYLVGAIAWRCSGATYSGVLQMRVTSLKPARLEVRVRNRGIADDCAAALSN